MINIFQAMNRVFKATLLFFLLANAMALARDASQIVQNSPGNVIVEITLDSVWVSSDNLIHTSPFLDQFMQPGLPLLPFYQEVLVGIPANADVKVFSTDNKYLTNYSPIIQEAERAKGIDVEIPITTYFDGNFPKQKATLTSTIDVYDKTASILEIFPVKIQPG